MKHWRLIISKKTDPYENLAIEETIFLTINLGKSPNTLFICKNQPSVIIGISEKVEEVVNLDLCRKYGINIVRRYTGGGTVFHDLGNLNWSIMWKKKENAFIEMDGIYKVYHEVGSIIVEAIHKSGVNAYFNPPNSIFVAGKKVSGMAMYVKKNAILCHGTLLVDSNLEFLSMLLKQVKYNVTNLCQNNLIIEQKEIVLNIIQSLKKKINCDIKKGLLNKIELFKINEIPASKYNPFSYHEKRCK